MQANLEKEQERDHQVASPCLRRMGTKCALKNYTIDNHHPLVWPHFTTRHFEDLEFENIARLRGTTD